MSKAEYSYPEDEFDVPSNPDVPRGVHRAPRSAWSRWWPFAVVLVVAPVLAFTLVNLAARDGNLPALPGTSNPAVEPSPEAPTEGETAAETPPVEEPVAPQPVMDTPIVVLNAAGIGGLAAEQAEELTTAGFTAVTTGNIEATTDDSVVYYASEDQKVTADLVAQTLGVATVTAGAPNGGTAITVVLVTDPDA
ncbi:LytR C-terminal domain-containing protein [Cellulomonas fengjieae]|uniref:LytR C-terminal domain-containing protein n=1 Tax=Cellulomonas fengjieae TaxID=2819978 RepID=A0ABS3SGW8_9CELL|nr:LytR C-terminal domain-containing protein [Cellulomonas fengjieae]MBO3084984.1 LytR C-terminal domain-containing protein [Cellulomonas fengjieae]MBO3100731.1 LytR C-terminal domain-containing protein [Cellulomonas fengjieae]QVI66418.1 LytR C-terminal domain-containing protein [Cellulomonas fengjieae]